MNLKTKVEALRKQLLHRSIDDVERMLNATKATGITPALVEAAKKTSRYLVVHSDSWKEKLQTSNPGLVCKLPSEVRGGELVLIDNGVNHILLTEARALQRLCEDLLNYIEVKKIEDKP